MDQATLQYIVTKILNGFEIGATYMLIALGLTLIFGTLGVVNFAHGALYLIAAYAAVIIASQVDFLLAIVLVPAILFAVGLVLERGLIRLFYRRPHTDQILVTFGVAIIVQEALKWYFGSNNIPFAMPEWGNGVIFLQDIVPGLEAPTVYRKWSMFLIGVSWATVLSLFLLLRFTRFGMVVRAGMRDPEMLRFLGINVTKRFAIVFGIGALIAGIAGVFGGPLTQVSPEVGMSVLVPSFLVVVIGGMGSLAGAMLASVVIGMALAFTAAVSELNQTIIYIIAVVVLLVRPRGLLGQSGVME
jgi:branched-chain amino acid transport system permease protein